LTAALYDGADQCDEIRAEHAAAVELGFDAQFLSAGPLLGRPAVQYSNQAIFHPVAYLSALARAVHGDGSYVFDRAEFSEPIEDPLAVIVNGENVTCDYLIIATHVPLMGLTGLLSATLFQTKLYPYSSYVLGARIPRDAAEPGVYSDTSDPYYYLRVHDTGSQRYAIFGGADHKTGHVEDTAACYAQVERTLKKIFPAAAIERRWSGQVIETNDGLPYIGSTADRQFVATGFAGNGLTFGTLAGMMARDFVQEASNPWQALLDPKRKRLDAASLTTLLGENVDYPARFVLDRLRKDRRAEVRNVAPGEGRVIQRNGKSVAVHRTESGDVILVSAVCTHLGCHVRWNRAEQTWDCPCHGSRFTPEGLVLGGPAEEPLERIPLAG